MNIASLSLTELIQCIRRREMAPSELVRTYLDRIDLHFQRGRVKVEIGLAKGKKQHDKRDAEKERDWNREKARLMRTKI